MGLCVSSARHRRSALIGGPAVRPRLGGTRDDRRGARHRGALIIIAPRTRKKRGSRGGGVEGRELDCVAEVGEAAEEPPGLGLSGTSVEVVGAEVRVGG